MDSSQATAWLTDARFAPYLSEAGGDHERAVALYVWNAHVSAAVFETLHHVEVLLRLPRTRDPRQAASTSLTEASSAHQRRYRCPVVLKPSYTEDTGARAPSRPIEQLPDSYAATSAGASTREST